MASCMMMSAAAEGLKERIKIPMKPLSWSEKNTLKKDGIYSNDKIETEAKDLRSLKDSDVWKLRREAQNLVSNSKPGDNTLDSTSILLPFGFSSQCKHDNQVSTNKGLRSSMMEVGLSKPSSKAANVGILAEPSPEKVVEQKPDAEFVLELGRKINRSSEEKSALINKTQVKKKVSKLVLMRKECAEKQKLIFRKLDKGIDDDIEMLSPISSDSDSDSDSGGSKRQFYCISSPEDDDYGARKRQETMEWFPEVGRGDMKEQKPKETNIALDKLNSTEQEGLTTDELWRQAESALSCSSPSNSLPKDGVGVRRTKYVSMASLKRPSRKLNPYKVKEENRRKEREASRHALESMKKDVEWEHNFKVMNDFEMLTGCSVFEYFGPEMGLRELETGAIIRPLDYLGLVMKPEFRANHEDHFCESSTSCCNMEEDDEVHLV